MTIGIIGSAGRGPDAARLNPGYWRSMKTVAQVVTTMTGADTIVSGAAPWCDHLSVALFLEGLIPNLHLHLAAEWTGFGFKEGSSDAAATANYYHEAFSKALGINSFDQIQEAIEKGAVVKVNRGGFKARNADIANEADTMLAFTFSGGPLPKAGGTAHTWGLFQKEAQRRFDHVYQTCYQESPCGCSNNLPDSLIAYHFDLTEKRLHRHVHKAVYPSLGAPDDEIPQPEPPPAKPVVLAARTQFEIDNDLL